MTTIEPAIREEKLNPPEEVARRLGRSTAWVYRTFHDDPDAIAFSKPRNKTRHLSKRTTSCARLDRKGKGRKNMPCDKLVLLSPNIRSYFRKIAEEKGKPVRGYSRYYDLRQTIFALPVRLYCDGFKGSMNKLQFDGVANLTPSRVSEIARIICGNEHSIRIFRIDWCVDVPDISVDDIIRSCRLKNAQNYTFIKSRTGSTVYLRFSKQAKLLVYDRLGRLRAKRDPLAAYYRPGDVLTRIEVQWQGKGVPFKDFDEIDRYSELDPLSGISFWEVNRHRSNLNVPESLAAEGLLKKIETYGMQGTSKMYPSQTWAYITKRFLVPSSEGRFPDLKRQMRKSIREWLENRTRFPRLLKCE